MLFEDDELLAVSKPPGMSVHGGAGEPGPTLIELLRAAYPGPSLDLVNRLDRATSGVVLLAKSSEIAGLVGGSWETAKKTYLAVALGLIKEDAEIDAPVEDRRGQKKAARTIVHPLAKLEKLEPKTTLCAIELGTGRTHQIRLHLAELRHPVLMDEKHGDFRANKAWSRALRDAGVARSVKHLMLHSYRLDLAHPRRNERVPLTAEPPEAWGDILVAAGAPVDVLHEFP